MKYSFCSFSFNRLLAAGKQDIFKYIEDSKALGACRLDPWNSHLAPIRAGDDVIRAGGVRAEAGLTGREKDYLKEVCEAAGSVGLPWGTIACDGAHIYEEDEAARKVNRLLAYRYIDVAEFLGAAQVRIDAGGPEDMPDAVFRIIAEGYEDVIGRAAERGIEVLTENHWGPTKNPDNVVKLMENIQGLGLLFDTNNWVRDRREEAWERCAGYASATHIKTFVFDENGWEPSVDLKKAVDILREAGYDGVWGIESCPRDGNEMEGARKTVELLKMALA